MGRNELSQRVRLIPYVIAIENQLLPTAKRTSKNPPHLPIPFSIDLLSRFCRRNANGYGGLIEGGRLIFPVLHPMAIRADPGGVYESLPVPCRRVRCKQRKAFLSTPFGPVCEAVHMCHLHKSLHGFLRRHRRHTAGMSAPKSW